MGKKEWTTLEKRAIALRPDLPEDLAAAFAEELLTIVDENGTTLGESLRDIFHPPVDPDLPPAKPGSMQELFPWLRDPRYM